MLPLLLGCFRLKRQDSDIQSVVCLCHESNMQASLASLLILAQAQELLSVVSKLSQIDSLLTKPLSNDSLRDDSLLHDSTQY
jgi:hypothetical protein